MKRARLSRGAVKSISVYDPDICQSVSKPRRKPGEAEEPLCKQHKPIKHNDVHIKKRNHNILKTLGLMDAKPQCFLTLQSTISNPSSFRKNFDKFVSWFKRKYEKGWMFYTFECSVTGNIHVHVFVHLGTDGFDLESFKYVCWRKWAIINSNPDERLVEVTQFHVKQLGYVASGKKSDKNIALLDIFQTAQTFGFINKKNVKFIDKDTYEVSDNIIELVDQFILSIIDKHDLKLKRKASNSQRNKIIHFGAYCQHGLTDEEVAYLNVICNWDELIKLYEVADSSLFDDLPEWPSDSQLEPDDEEPIYGSGDQDSIDGYLARFEEK